MKRITAFLLALILILSSLTALTSCSGKDSDIPEGMQLVRGGADVGYYMYAPEEWVVANQEELNISCAYVSKVNNTCVTLAESSFTKENVGQYVAAELERFPEALKKNETLALKEASLGNAEAAWKVAYTIQYDKYEYQILQIFALFGESSYIFTYSASTGKYDNESSYYDKFLEKAEDVIKNIKFVEKKLSEDNSEPTYEKDGDGFSLVSNKKLCGFDLYIPDTYKVDFSTSIVSATRADGTNVNVSEATDTNTESVGYWETRFKTLRSMGAEVELIMTESEDIKGAQVLVDLGGKLRATSLKYSITFGESTSYVYQVLIVKGFNGYVFTYTADAEDFEANFAEAQTILNKIEF